MDAVADPDGTFVRPAQPPGDQAQEATSKTKAIAITEGQLAGAGVVFSVCMVLSLTPSLSGAILFQAGQVWVNVSVGGDRVAVRRRGLFKSAERLENDQTPAREDVSENIHHQFKPRRGGSASTRRRIARQNIL